MKRIYFVFAALLLSLFTAADSYGAIKLRIMSFNIRCLNGGDAPENQWDQRADRVGEYINEVKPDLFGMQEVVYKQFEDVKARVKGYECIYAGRDDGKNGGEGTPIFYRPDKYRLIKSGHYWLSETPEKPTFGWKAACLRIALWAVFEDIKSGERFIYCNTHFDHISVEARKQSAMLAKDRHATIDPPEKFDISDEEYENFKRYAKEHNFTYDRQSVKLLDNLKKVAKFEGYDVAEDIKALEAKLTHNEDYDFEHWKPEIKKLLNNEIMLRYYYRRGLIRNSLNNDKTLDTALAVLNNPQEYRKMLAPQPGQAQDSKPSEKK